MNRACDIAAALRESGIETYLPSAHPGICTSPYAVVQACGSYLRSESRLGGVCRYRVHIFVPADRPALLEPFALEVQRALDRLALSGVIRMSSPRSPAAVNDRFAALGCYLEYASEFRA